MAIKTPTNTMAHTPGRYVAAIAALLSTGLGGCASDVVPTASPSAHPLSVVLDYSPTLSDAGALLYLASNPAVDLLAVTLPGTGEADCEPGTRITHSLLTVAGKGDVAVGCGRDTPLVGDRDWPNEWRAEANHWGDGILPSVETEPVRDAEQLLVDTLSGATAPVTVVAVAPLTNLGAVLVDHPELASRIERIVIMGGAVDVPGNVEDAPAAEWNLYVDPEAARRVFAAGVPVTLVPLDATNDVPWSDRLSARLASLDGAAAQTESRLTRSRESLEGLYLWDELAAVVAVRPDVVTFEQRTVAVDASGSIVADPDGATVEVGVGADAAMATDEFVRTLNGGSLPAVAPIDRIELGYLVDMGGASTHFNAAMSRAYATDQSNGIDDRETAARFVTVFFDAFDALETEATALTPPPSLAEAHGQYLDALAQLLASRADVLAALAEADGATADELLGNTAARTSVIDLMDSVTSACQVIEDYSYLRDGPNVCPGGG